MTTTAAAVPFAPVAAARQVGKWTVAVSIAIGSVMATIDTSIVNVAMPQSRGELGASLQEITWVTTAYLIAMVLVMPLTGFLGSFFGQKRVYIASLVLFTIGSVLCGTARSLEMLVLWRILQGIGGGALQPTQQAILRQTFPPAEQGIAMGRVSVVILGRPAVGPGGRGPGWLAAVPQRPRAARRAGRQPRARGDRPQEPRLGRHRPHGDRDR